MAIFWREKIFFATLVSEIIRTRDKAFSSYALALALVAFNFFYYRVRCEIVTKLFLFYLFNGSRCEVSPFA